MALQLMRTKNKSNSHNYNQYQLKFISDKICDNIETVLSRLDITEYKMCSRMISTSCPIHGGDNESALNLYHTGDSYRGNWKCRTHQCEKIFKASVIGFIRGVLSHKKYGWSKNGDTMVSFQETMKVVEDILGGETINNHQEDSCSIEKQKFATTIKYLSSPQSQTNISNAITKHIVQKSLDIPSKYFLDRGFDTETLTHFDVGECNNPNKEMYDRAVVPIYDLCGKFVIACTGRSIFEKCTECGSYHNPQIACSKKHIPKWKHSLGFRSEESIYNIWYAQKYIQESKTAIIVESPGNVWKLYEAGIFNAIAIFGSSLSDKQKMILDTSGAMKLITIMDNDEAGEKAAKSIEKKCNKTYVIKHLALKNLIENSEKYSDIGDLSRQQIIDIIKPNIGDIK